MLPFYGPADAAGGSLAVLSPVSRSVSFGVLFALCGAYSVWLWTGRRRTLPMKTWHIGLESADGAAVSPRRALVRYLACWVGPACAILAYLLLEPHGHGRWALAMLALNHAWALIDPDRQFLHDRIAGTRLVADRPPHAGKKAGAAAGFDVD